MRTQFDQSHKDFSDKAHLAAQKLIYPKIFNTNNLKFETTDLKDSEHSRILDGEMGIDRIVYVIVDNLKAPIKFTIQERFRSPQYLKWQDITITEWNNNSNLPSELYKINSGYFVYGYFDVTRNIFLDAICISVPDLLHSIVTNSLVYSRRINPKNQNFIGLKFQDLHNVGLVTWRLRN